MSFDANNVDQGGTGNIDFDKINEYMIETCGLQNRETLKGYISMIADLGTQTQEDAEVKFEGNAQEEAEIMKEMPDTYFKDGTDYVTKRPVRLKCWPQKSVQCVAVAIDFPDILVNKGQFFGEDKGEELPLRIWMGGQFWKGPEIGMTVGQMTPLKMNKKLGSWSFDKKHTLHKMAVGSKLIGTDECFVPQQIDQLLGQFLQFDVQVYMKAANNGKSYYTEYIKFVSGLGRGDTPPEKLTTPMLVMMQKDNDDLAVKHLPKFILNTMAQASDWETSSLKEQVARVKGVQATSAKTEAKAPANDNVASKPLEKAVEPTADGVAGFDDFDDD